MKKIAYLSLSLLTLTSCVKPIIPSTSTSINSTSSVDDSVTPSTSVTTSTSTTTSVPSTSVELPEELSLFDEFYSPDSKVEIVMNFTNESIYKLAKYSDDEYKKDMYHPVDVKITINGRDYNFEECGARMKGNTSRNPNFVTSSGDIVAPVHFKISFNQTFDDKDDNDYYTHDWSNDAEGRQNRKDRRFVDAKKFDIKYNKNQDYTFTRQIYAYECFKEEGIIAQYNNLVKVTINTETDSYTSVYEAQECIDKEFLKRRFDKASQKGNLYKSTYTSMGPADYTKDSLSRVGVEAPNFHPSYDLKTNDDPEEIDHTLLTNLITTLNDDHRPAAQFKDTLESLVDVEQIIKYQAMSWVIGNPDDSRNNYNNHYLYFDSSSNKAILIPYDFDRCFGILQDWAIHMHDVPHYTTKTNANGREWQRNPLLWRTIIETSDTSVDYSSKWSLHPEYKALYDKYALEYATKYLDVNKYNEFTNRFYYANKDISNGGGSNHNFAYYATEKLKTFN